jgi:hypothetical protein
MRRSSHSLLSAFLVISFLLSAPSCTLSSDTKKSLSTAAVSITPDELRDHIFFLASDALGGRGLGSEGYRIATLYAASQFEEAGCRPIMKDEDGKETFFQRFFVNSKDVHIYVPKSAEIATRARDQQGAVEEGFDSENVVAMIEGSDPVLKEQYVTVSAHLDHVGTIAGKIYNGADDNASGCAAVLEIAEGVAIAQPRRSVIFILFGAEESGLHGSKFFVDNCPVPLQSIVADINLDMVGRFENPASREGIIAVGASAICDDMKSILEAVNAGTIELKLDETSGDQFFRDSDQFNFHQKGIPVVFFFDGLHKDFHTPGDDADKIDYPHMADVTRLACEFALELANRDQIPCASNRQ